MQKTNMCANEKFYHHRDRSGWVIKNVSNVSEEILEAIFTKLCLHNDKFTGCE